MGLTAYVKSQLNKNAKIVPEVARMAAEVARMAADVWVQSWIQKSGLEVFQCKDGYRILW